MVVLIEVLVLPCLALLPDGSGGAGALLIFKAEGDGGVATPPPSYSMAAVKLGYSSSSKQKVMVEFQVLIPLEKYSSSKVATLRTDGDS